jgi:hypothetical protein
MFCHIPFASFIAYLFMMLQPELPAELIPVEAGVEDRGSLSESLRTATLDTRQDQSFERLYKIEGSDGVYVRKAGGLYAVFKNSTYIDTQQGSIAIVPAGTVYSIGLVNVALLQQLGTLSKPTIPNEMVRAEDLLYSPNSIPKKQYASASPALPRNGSVRFVSDENYRRNRLAMMVLETVLQDSN